MKTTLKSILALIALVALASCARNAPTVPSYAPDNQGGGYIVPSK